MIVDLNEEPVVADDGYTYERVALSEWMEQRDKKDLVSIKTEKRMNDQMRTDFTGRRTIETLVASGKIDTKKVNQWKAKKEAKAAKKGEEEAKKEAKNKAKLDELRRRAADNDGEAMYYLALAHITAYSKMREWHSTGSKRA